MSVTEKPLDTLSTRALLHVYKKEKDNPREGDLKVLCGRDAWMRVKMDRDMFASMVLVDESGTNFDRVLFRGVEFRNCPVTSPDTFTLTYKGKPFDEATLPSPHNSNPTQSDKAESN